MALLILIYAALPLLQAAVLLHSMTGFGMTAFEMLNYLSSVSAFHWLLANVLMGAKIPWFQQAVPYDKRIRFHIYATFGIIAAVGYHGIFKAAMHYYIDPVTWILIGVIASFVSLAVLWIPVPGFRKIREAFLSRRKKMKEGSYDSSKKTHGILVLALSGLLLIHVVNSGIFFQVPAFSTALYWFYYLTAVGLYAASLLGAFRAKAKVVSVEEKEGIVRLRLRVNPRFSYKSGQFAFVSIPGGEKGEHPFSFLSHETVDGKDTVTFAARRVGRFTAALSRLVPGDAVRIRGAFGDFRPRGSERVCLIGSGIGTVPVISLLKELYTQDEEKDVTAILSVEKRDEIPELSELLTFDADAGRAERIAMHVLVREEGHSLLTEEYFRATLAENMPDLYYVCSSPKVRRIVIDALRKLGVPKNSIRYESFAFA